MARSRTRFAPRSALPAFAASVAVLCAPSFMRPAQASLITDGTFTSVQNGATEPGVRLCYGQAGTAGGACTESALTDWSTTCGPGGCAGGATPASLLFNGPGGQLYTGGWNGTIGVYGPIADAPTGGNVVAIDGDTQYRSSISQLVSGLTVGQDYVLTFYQGAAQQSGASGATTEQWEVTLGGTSEYSAWMSNASKGVVPWQQQTLQFVATSTSETLTFLALSPNTGLPPISLLADVDLEVPEPAAFSVLPCGMLALYALRRRRAQRAVK